jgi:hypothetical protein
MVDGLTASLTANVAQSALEASVPSVEAEELRRIRELNEGLLNQAHKTHVTPAPVTYTFYDQPITLQANVELQLDPDIPLDTLTHCSIFPYAAAPVAVVLRGHGADIAVNLPANKWSAIEVPTRTVILLPGGATQVAAVLRYANERWGAVLP